MTRSVPPLRIHVLNPAPVADDGDYVLYWMIAYRRVRANFALQRAVELARSARKPLVILEALRCGYPWASDRLHRFAVDGMQHNAAELANSPAFYYPYLEPKAGAGRGLLEALARRACAVVTDDFPCFFLPRMVAAAAPRVSVRFEQVDSNGLLPMRATADVFPTAYAFRRFLQRTLPAHLLELPVDRPLSGSRLARLASLPESITRRWPRLAAVPSLERLPIDHAVAPVTTRGGAHAARVACARFLGERLLEYGEARNEPEHEVTSGLSPYLHFGHISAHEILDQLAAREGWSLDRVASQASGKRAGWWGMSPAAESFLDQLVTWREIGFNRCAHRPDYDRYESLPDWASATLAKHRRDTREPCYELAELEAAATHDELWNAAQRQLVRDGRIHNYLRMLWGKKILEWTRSPEAALAIMIELNNKYALDGRNPNSYSGIFWVLGRYDRPWGPERPIFGTVRFMSSDSTRRKFSVAGYVAQYAEAR